MLDKANRGFSLLRDMLPVLGVRLAEFYLPGHNASHKIYIPQIDSTVLLRTNSSDVPVLREILTGGSYTFPANILDLLTQRPDSYCVIDFGANIGIATLRIAQQLTACGITNIQGLCVEPDTENYSILSANVNHGFKSVNAAVASERTNINITNKNSRKSYSVLQTASDPNGEVRGRTPGTFLRLLGKSTERNVILKVDIEGAEIELFQRKDEWIDRTLVLFIERHDDTLGVPFEECLDVLERSGFIPVAEYSSSNPNDLMFVHKSILPQEGLEA